VQSWAPSVASCTLGSQTQVAQMALDEQKITQSAIQQVPVQGRRDRREEVVQALTTALKEAVEDAPFYIRILVGNEFVARLVVAAFNAVGKEIF